MYRNLVRGEGPGVPRTKGSSKTNYHVIAFFGLVLLLRLVSLPVPERIEVPVIPASGPYWRFFPREAVRHPAKANLRLVERLSSAYHPPELSWAKGIEE
jgi:hypothetical protein